MLIDQRAVSPVPQSELLRQRELRFPNEMKVTSQMVAIGSHAAADVATFLDGTQNPSPDQFDPVKITMDNLAAASLEHGLLIGTDYVVDSKLSEGKKDEEKTGIHVKTVIGRFHRGMRLRLDSPIPFDATEGVSIVNDPVEQTDSAMAVLSHGWDSEEAQGAAVVLGVTKHGSVREVPEGIKYMEKFMGPKELRGKVDIRMDTRERIFTAAQVLGVKPDQIDVVGLNRDRHSQLIEEVKETTASWIGIQRGDFLPGIKAIIGKPYMRDGKPRYLLSMGAGGYEEGVADAIAAVPLGFFQGRVYHEKPEVMERFGGKVLEARDLVGENPRENMVVYSSITRDPWLGNPGILRGQDQMTVYSNVISHRGEQRYAYQIPLVRIQA